MSSIPFAKMNGIGNSILVVDLRGSGRTLGGAAAKRIGASMPFDQLMVIGDRRSRDMDAYVDIFNIDGSRAGACGNGTRCVAWTMLRGQDTGELRIETVAGPLPARRLDAATFTVDMGPPRLAWHEIPLAHPVADTGAVDLPSPPAPGLSRFSAVSMGNPHAVFFVPDAEAIDLHRMGPPVETHPIFPDRVNVSFATIVDRRTITLRTWERGAGATLACGSAACATLVAAARAGLTEREAQVRQAGGSLTIQWRPDNEHVVMVGGVELEHEGVLPLSMLDDAA